MQITKSQQTRSNGKDKPKTNFKMSRKKAVKYADDMMSLFIRQRDKLCYCGKPSTQNGHLITRASYATRWDEKNCHGCCQGHYDNLFPPFLYLPEDNQLRHSSQI
jgi:hypothetical protein